MASRYEGRPQDVPACRAERPCRRAAEQRDELAPLHSITSSVRASIADGSHQQLACSLSKKSILLRQSAFMPWTNQGLGAEPGEPPPITDAPFKNQSTTCPVLGLNQRMSLLLSPLKSPVSAIVHGLPAEPGEPPPITEVPLRSQITASPVAPLSQRMSLIPSPLKSPVPATVHGLPAEPGEPPPITEVPLSNQITAWPVLVLYQRMSVLPSPLKSPVPATVHGLPAEPGEPPPITDVPC